MSIKQRRILPAFCGLLLAPAIAKAEFFLASTYDPDARAVFAVRGVGDFGFGAYELWRIDSRTAHAQVVGELDSSLLSQVAAMAYDDERKELVAVTNTGAFVMLDRETAEAPPAGAVPYSRYTTAMTFTDADLLGISEYGDLFSINETTATTESIGRIHLPNIEEERFQGIAYRTSESEVLVVEYRSHGLWRVDSDTAEAVEIGRVSTPLGDKLVGLGWDPTDDVLYSVTRDTNTLIRIDPTTGESVTVGSITVGATSSEPTPGSTATRMCGAVGIIPLMFLALGLTMVGRRGKPAGQTASGEPSRAPEVTIRE